MHSNIIIFVTFIAVFKAVTCAHGKSGKEGPACNEFDPRGVKNLNFDDLVGKWYMIASVTAHDQPTLDVKIEWISGTNIAIKSVRSEQNPNLCSTQLRIFTPTPDTGGSSFNMTFEEENKIIEWRMLYLDSEFAATWGCFGRDDNNVCNRLGGRLLRRTADDTISEADMSRMDDIMKQKTCKTISEAYPIKIPVNNECPDWRLPTKTTC